MTNDTKQEQTRDTVLAELHEMLPGATASDVTAFADAHPQYSEDILAFAAEWLAIAPEAEAEMDETGPAPEASPAVLAALERFHAAAPAPATDPFAALDLAALERLAADCRIDTGILRKIEKRLIDALTMPGKLLAWLAQGLGRDTATLLGFLSGQPVAANADFLAPGGPKAAVGKISFADAVRASSLPDGDKDFWLREAGG